MKYHAGMMRRRIVCGHSGKTLPVTMWYPTHDPETQRREGIFDLNVAWQGRPDPGRYPLVSLSHGSGGSDINHHDWAEDLARAGFVVVAPKHVGDSHDAQTGIASREQLLERPRQLNAAIDAARADPDLGPHIDPARIGAMGFSVGGYTTLILLGAVPDFSRWRDYCAGHPETSLCPCGHSPRVPDATADDWRGVARPGIRSAVLLAPFALLFGADALSRITVPVRLFLAEEDSVARNNANGFPLAANLGRNPVVEMVGGEHYVFIAPVDREMMERYPKYYVDAAGVERRAIHAAVGEKIVEFFKETL